MSPCLLALETSCDETAASIVDASGQLLSSEVASQIEIHRAFGGVVPEVASRNHVLHMKRLVEVALQNANVQLSDIGAFAATSGPGLVSALLIGSTFAKALAVANRKPFLGINHLEGHLLSPFMGEADIPPHISLIVSGGHTMLLDVAQAGDYTLIGRTRDDAAGEAFDKVAKMLGLPYPGGPEIDKLALGGNPKAYSFPRSMMEQGNFEFSFSGLKTAVLYHLPKVDLTDPQVMHDLCASFQESIIEVLVKKSLAAAKLKERSIIAISGGVSCNRRLREAFQEACAKSRVKLRLCQPKYSTDNAAMIAYAGWQRWKSGFVSPIEMDVDPNLPLYHVA